MYDLMSPSTHYGSFWRQVLPVNHLQFYRQPNQNNQETEHKQTQYKFNIIKVL